MSNRRIAGRRGGVSPSGSRPPPSRRRHSLQDVDDVVASCPVRDKRGWPLALGLGEKGRAGPLISAVLHFFLC